MEQNEITFSWRRSRAIWRLTAFMSVLFKALVMYKWRSKKRSMTPPSSACSTSNWDNKWTNHSKLRWSRLIQKKSTCNQIVSKFKFCTFFFFKWAIIYFFKVHNGFGHIGWPAVLTSWTTLLTCVITVHDGLEDAGEWSDTDSGRDKNCVTRVKDVTRWCSIWSVYGDLLFRKHLANNWIDCQVKLSLLLKVPEAVFLQLLVDSLEV